MTSFVVIVAHQVYVPGNLLSNRDLVIRPASNDPIEIAV